MEKIRILTDSGSDMPAPYPENLTVLPLSIHFGKEEYLDGVTLDYQTFYQKLTSSKTLPKTSLVPPGDFAEAFDRAEENGETVIAVILSSRLSGTYQSAVLAAQGRERVYVVDSLNATLGQQILVRYALSLAEQGMAAQEIVAELERVKSHARLMGMPDTLEYLRKGGRISGTVAFVGEALAIKPVLALQEGVIVMLGKARGSRNGNNYLIKEVEKANGVDFSKPFAVGYSGLDDKALQRYIQDSRQLWEGKTESLPITTVGPTIGTHLGPGAVIVAFFDNL